MRSPCFVHSKLQGPSFTEWLREKQNKAEQEAHLQGPNGVDVNPVSISYPDDGLIEVSGTQKHQYVPEDDEETAGSLTKQLAETAVGVREMSKQLGEFTSSSRRTNVSLSRRSYPRSFQHPVYPYCHESTRQSSHQTHARTCIVSYVKTTEGREGYDSVSISS